MIPEELHMFVKQGVYWLDENYPEWENKIDLMTLSLESCESCVLGQVAGNYTNIVGVDADVNNTEWAIEHGFALSNALVGSYDQLTDAWKDYIVK